MTHRCAASLTRRAFLRQGACGLATAYTLGTAHAGPRSAGKEKALRAGTIIDGHAVDVIDGAVGR